MEQTPNQNNELNSADVLDDQDTVVVSDTTQSPDSLSNENAEPPPPPSPQKPSRKKKLAEFLKKINIYFLLMILLLLIAAMIVFVSYKKEKSNSDNKSNVSTEKLSQDVLDQLRQTDVKVGDPKQTLSVEANAIFAGKVLIRDGLEVAGQIKVGGPLSLPGLTVSGSSILDQVQINNLQVSGNTTIQGQLSVQKNLTIAGSASIGGLLTASQLNIENLQVNGDLRLNKHIDAGGGIPGKSNGSALGAGGTSSISGTDTAGTVNINTGGGAGAGCFANITFVQKFNDTPHVVITPVGSAGGSLDYYINRSNTGFSICASNTPPSGASFAFDYIVID